jgi:hypothetical protein
MLDQYKAYTREQRAELMAQWAKDTQARFHPATPKKSD